MNIKDQYLEDINAKTRSEIIPSRPYLVRKLC